MTDAATTIWPIIQAHLAGLHSFDTAAARLATVLREWEDRRDQQHATNAYRTAPSGHGLWIPLDRIAETDRPTVSALLKRAYEILRQSDGEAA